MNLTFSIEPVASVWNEKVECARKHWQKTTMCANGEVLVPKLERYQQYEAMGAYIEFVARCDGEFAGFCGMYLVPSMHTQDLLATEDIIYLKPEYRKGSNGIRFYRFIVQQMRLMGAKKIMVTAPPGSVACRILEHIGFNHSANGYSKLLTR